MSKPQGAPAPVLPTLPDQLYPTIDELTEVSNLAEFLCMFLMRTKDCQEENLSHLSLSLGEASALINLLQTVLERTLHAHGELTDLWLRLKGEEESHE